MKSQRTKLLELLKKSPQGVNSYYATYELSIKQAPTRIKELRDEGYNIISIPERDRSVTWVLDSRGINRSGRPEMTDQLAQKSPRLEEQYIFLPSGVAVPRESLEPRQEVLI